MFSAILIAKVILWQSVTHVFPGILTPMLTQLSFHSHWLPFAHASAVVRGKDTPKQKFASTGYLTHNHQALSPTCSPLRYRAGLCIVIAWLILTHSHTVTPFDAPGKQAFWKHCGKRRNCSQRAIFSFPTVFSTRLDNFLPFSSYLELSSAKSFSLEESKICRLVMG